MTDSAPQEQPPSPSPRPIVLGVMIPVNAVPWRYRSDRSVVVSEKPKP